MAVFGQPNGTTIVDMVKYANDVTGEMFGVMTVVSLFVIAFMSLKFRGFSTPSSLSAASFIGFVSSLFMWMLGIAPSLLISPFVTMFVIAVFFVGRGGD